MPNSEPCSKSELLMTADYICVTYGYSLQGCKGLWVDYQHLIDGIHIGKYGRWEPHAIVLPMGRFNGEDGNCMNLLPLINLTSQELGFGFG